MRFSEADNSGGHPVEAYGSEGLLIDGRWYRRGLILTPARIVEDWGPTLAADLTADHLDEVLALAPQILLLGTGSTQVFPAPALYARLMQARIGVEIMDTGAACRTYNILMSEGRRVVAALMPF